MKSTIHLGYPGYPPVLNGLWLLPSVPWTPRDDLTFTSTKKSWVRSVGFKVYVALYVHIYIIYIISIYRYYRQLPDKIHAHVISTAFQSDIFTRFVVLTIPFWQIFYLDSDLNRTRVHKPAAQTHSPHQQIDPTRRIPRSNLPECDT